MTSSWDLIDQRVQIDPNPKRHKIPANEVGIDGDEPITFRAWKERIGIIYIVDAIFGKQAYLRPEDPSLQRVWAPVEWLCSITPKINGGGAYLLCCGNYGQHRRHGCPVVKARLRIED